MNAIDFKIKETWNDGYIIGKTEQYNRTLEIIDRLIHDEYLRVNQISGIQLNPIDERVDPAFIPIMNKLKQKLAIDME